MARSASGQPRCPQVRAEESGIDVYALIEVNRRAEITRLRQERRQVVEWLDGVFVDLDEELANGATLPEIRARLAKAHDELVRFHHRHYAFSEQGTAKLCDDAQTIVREVNRYAGWWQQIKGTTQLTLAGV